MNNFQHFISEFKSFEIHFPTFVTYIFVILEITYLSLCRWISKAISQDRYPSDGKGSYLPLACQNAEAGSALELNISHTLYLLQVFRIIFLPHKVVFILLFCKITEFINDWLLS